MKPRSCSVMTFVGVACVALSMTAPAKAGFVTFEAAGVDPASITPTRDAFRVAVGGGAVAGGAGSFGGIRREINWDGVPAGFADPNALPANFFNVNSPRGVVFSTPGTGFLVSANAGDAAPVLFGFPNDFQTFSAQRLFVAQGSTITDIDFFVAGTNTLGMTSAFGVVFTDVEVADLTTLEFFDSADSIIYSHSVLASGNQGLSFLGAMADAGEAIARVRITSGANTILSNGNLANPVDDIVAMDDFIYAEPQLAAVPEPGALSLLAFGLVPLRALRRRRRG